MTLHAYKAMNAGGGIVHGRMDAINPVDLELRLRRIGLDLISGDPVSTGSLFPGARVPRLELINFCFHLEQLTRAGVPLIDGLADLRDSVTHPRFREVIAGMIESIEGGRTLSRAMAEYPRVFDGVFVSLIRAGEDSGNLPAVLGNLIASIKWQDELAAHARKLVMYPAFLGAVVIGVTLFMMIYLVPRMASFIRNLGQELPMQTRLLIMTSDFFVGYGHLLVGLPVAVAIVVALFVRGNPRARRHVDAFKLGLPLVGDIQRKIILSRFASLFAMMYASGISVLDALRATEDAVGNLVIKDGLKRVGEMIGEGQGISEAFRNAGLFPPLVLRMLRVGESSGGLDTALINVSYFYNRDVKESIERVRGMIEPVLTLVVGVVLGWVMLAVLGPIYDVITRLKI